MALTPHTDQAFLREIDEELRRDQLTTFWQRYGRIALAAVAAALVAFGGYLYWQHRRTVAAGEQGEKLSAAFDQIANGQTATASGALAEVATDGPQGYRAIAQFAEADLLLKKGDAKGAAAKFAAIAADGGQAQPFRDLALVRQTATEYDTLAPQAVIDRLRTLATPGHAFFGSAGEMVAIAYVRSGRRDLAARLFDQIARDETVPDSIRQRAVQMAGSMGVDASTPAAAGVTNKGKAE